MVRALCAFFPKSSSTYIHPINEQPDFDPSARPRYDAAMTENEPSALKQLLDAVTEGTIQVGPPANGDHITRQEILEISSRENQDPPLYLLCDRYRAVDVYHALQREADAGTIQPVWKDEDTGYIFRWTKVDPPPGT